MIDRTELQKVYLEKKSYVETGKIFGVSRQRVHQLITGYKTLSASYSPSRKKGKWGFAKTLKELYLKPCKNCGGETKAIHHKDGHSSNNNLDNLIPVCTSCHYSIHKKMRADRKITTV